MRYLITGSAGFVGSHLTESLLEDGHSVLGIDCFNDNYGRGQKLANVERAKEWDGFEFVPIDLARGDLFELVEECDAVFHLAAEPGVRPSWGARFEQYLRNNVLATQHLLEAACSAPEKRFVHSSSSSIYGQAESFPTSEAVTPRPISPYGMTKLAAEHLCDLYHHNHGVATTSLRLFTVYGPRQRPDMAFNIFCRGAIQGSSVEVFGDGTQTRDFTYVGDVIRALRLAIESDDSVGQAINVGGGTQASVNEVLAIIERLSGRELDVKQGPPRAGDVSDTSADITRAADLLGFTPQTGLEVGLTAEWEWVERSLVLG